VQIDWFTFVAQIINFLVLIWLLHRFLYKPIIHAMDEREKKIASELEEARLKKVEAEQKEHEFDQKVKDIESRKSKLLEQAREEADLQQNEMMKEIREEIAGIKKRWEEAIQGEKDAFLTQLKQETGEQIIDLVKNILIDLTDRGLQEQTAAIFFEKLRTLDDKDRKRLKETIEELQINRAEIYSSFELDGQQKHQLTDLLRGISGRDLECEFNISDELAFGMEIRVGGWCIGWNLKRYLDSLRSNMTDFFSEQSTAGKLPEFK
jgi:F-type H+-transporting ATPase subunit b